MVDVNELKWTLPVNGLSVSQVINNRLLLIVEPAALSLQRGLMSAEFLKECPFRAGLKASRVAFNEKGPISSPFVRTGWLVVGVNNHEPNAFNQFFWDLSIPISRALIVVGQCKVLIVESWPSI